MSGSTEDRRALERFPSAGAIEVLVDDRSFPAVLSDISVAGLQARLDPMTFDEIREKIEAIRFTGGPPLPVKLEWGFFDGTFGASFRDRFLAEVIVDRYLGANG